LALVEGGPAERASHHTNRTTTPMTNHIDIIAAGKKRK
jgi:hypothetical protein